MRNTHVCESQFQCTHNLDNNDDYDLEQCSSRPSRRCWNRTPQPGWDDMNVRVNPNVDICDPWRVSSHGHGHGQRVFCSAFSTRDVSDHDDEMLIIPPQHSSISIIDLNWLETPSAHVLKADVPGLRKEDLSILIEGEVVKIRGQRTLDYFSNCLNKQLTWYIPFRRQFKLPPNIIVEDIKAVLDRGVLTITIPKIPIVPSIAWFIPIERSPTACFAGEVPNTFINIQNEREFTSDINEGGLCTPTLRVSPVRTSTRPRSLSESNVSFIFQDDPTTAASSSSSPSSSPKIQNIIVKRRGNAAAFPNENDASQQVHATLNIPASSSSASPSPKSLSVIEEDGNKSNAHITLNININAGKIFEGESSSSRTAGITDGVYVDDHEQDEDFAAKNYRGLVTANNSSPSSNSPSRSASVLRQRPYKVQFNNSGDGNPGFIQMDVPFSSPYSSRRTSRSSMVDPAYINEDLDPAESSELAPQDQHLVQRADERSTSIGPSAISRARLSSMQQQIQQEDEYDNEEVDIPQQQFSPAATPTQRKSFRAKLEDSVETISDPSNPSSPSQKRHSSNSNSPNEERFKGRLLSRRMTTGDVDSPSQNAQPQPLRRKTVGDSPGNKDSISVRDNRRSSDLSEKPDKGKSKLDTLSNKEPSNKTKHKKKSFTKEEPEEEDRESASSNSNPVEEGAIRAPALTSPKSGKRSSQTAAAAAPSASRGGSERLSMKEKELLKRRPSLPLPTKRSSLPEGKGIPGANDKRRNSSSAAATGAKRPSGSRRDSEAPQSTTIEETDEKTRKRSLGRRKSKQENAEDTGA